MNSANECWGPRGNLLRRNLARLQALARTRDGLDAKRAEREALLDMCSAEEAGALEAGRRKIAENNKHREEAWRRLALQRAAVEEAASRVNGLSARVRQTARRVFGGPSMAALREAHQQCCAGRDATLAQVETLAEEAAHLESDQAARQFRIDDHRYAVEHLQRTLDLLDADIRGLDAEVDSLLQAILLETPDALWEQRLRHLSDAGLIDSDSQFFDHLARVRDHGDWQACLPKAPFLSAQSGDIGEAVSAGLRAREYAMQGTIIVNGRGHHHRYHHGKHGGWRRHAVSFHGQLYVSAGFAVQQWRSESFVRSLGTMAAEAFTAGFASYEARLAEETETRRQQHLTSLAWFRNLLERIG